VKSNCEALVLFTTTDSIVVPPAADIADAVTAVPVNVKLDGRAVVVLSGVLNVSENLVPVESNALTPAASTGAAALAGTAFIP
jgi:hypothetical protein